MAYKWIGIVAWGLLLLSVSTAAAETTWVDSGPGTLFQWSGTNATAAPNLDEPLMTDRPDFTEASSTVGRGVLQLETGYTYAYDGEHNTHTHSLPEALFRLGAFAEWFEFRFAWGFIDGQSLEENFGGAHDLYVGAKIWLTPQAGILPEMALIPQAFIPIGDDDISSGEFLPGLNWLYGWDLLDWLSTAGSTQLNRSSDDGDTYYEFAQSWTFGYSITDRLSAYTEWFCLIPSGAAHAPTEHYANGGFTWLLNNNVQFDIRVGTGLSKGAEDFFTGVGCSIRMY